MKACRSDWPWAGLKVVAKDLAWVESWVANFRLIMHQFNCSPSSIDSHCFSFLFPSNN